MNVLHAIDRPRIGGLQLAIIALTLAAAAIHMSRALANARIAELFTLNAIGYVALVGLLYVPLPVTQRGRRAVRWTLIGYAALTFALYLVWGLMKGEWLIPIGPADKLIEALLVALLLVEARQVRQA
jgi:hypothetical protein